MCGISGTVNVQKSTLDMMLSKIEHRGRDERILFSSGSVNLGMNRLSINDTRHGHYPFKYRGKILFFNGEIYNFEDLKKTVKHYSCKTNCDGEIILPLVEKFGFEEAMRRIDGMFAIVVYDTESNILILSRDFFGEKPLYYKYSNDSFLFCSELTPLLESNETNKLCKQELDNYLYHGSSSVGNTLIKNIKKLPHHSVLRLDCSNFELHVESYINKKNTYVKRKNQEASSLDNKVQKLDKLLYQSVKSRLISDVPVGTFLSGGIDSSLVSLYAQNELGTLNTFSVTFPNKIKENEAFFSKKVAKQLGTNHHQLVCGKNEILETFKNLAELIDEPIVDPAILPTYLVSNLAREKVKVILTGEGADELFGGYKRYYKTLLVHDLKTLFHLDSKPVKILGKYRERLSMSESDYYSPQRVWSLDSKITDDFDPKIYLSKKSIKQFGLLKAMQLADINSYLSEQLLMKIDKSSMRANLECRAPFLSKKIFDFAMSLDEKDKLKFGQMKYALKKVAAKYFSPDIVWRLKHGFSVPLRDLFENELKSFLIDELQYLSEFKEINMKVVDSCLNDHFNKKSDNSTKIWSLLVFSIWAKKNNVAA